MNDYRGLPSVMQGFFSAQDREKQNQLGQLQQAQGLMQIQGLLAKRQQEQRRVQEEQQIKGVLAEAGGDPSRALKGLLTLGTPTAMGMANQLKGMIPKPAEPFKVGPDETAYNADGTVRARGGPRTVAPKEFAPPKIVEIMKAAGIGPDHPQYQKILGNAIRKESETAKQISPTIVMPRQPMPVQTHTDGAGNLWERERGGQWRPAMTGGGGSPGMAPKVPVSALKEQQARMKMNKELDLVIPTLEEISKEGGLLDQSTGSGFGAGVDAVGGFFGHATPGSIAVGRLKPLVDPILKLVPRFEGPQSDKDTQTYRDAAGDLSNPNTPNARKKAAANEILLIYKKRRNQFITKDYEAAAIDSGVSPYAGPDRRAPSGLPDQSAIDAELARRGLK